MLQANSHSRIEFWDIDGALTYPITGVGVNRPRSENFRTAGLWC